jgi:chromosome segregation ATPase
VSAGRKRASFQEGAARFLSRVQDVFSVLDPGLQYSVQKTAQDLEAANVQLEALEGELLEETEARIKAEAIAEEMGLRVEQLEEELEKAERTGRQIVETLEKQMKKLEGDLEAERVRNSNFAKQAKALQEGYSDLSDKLEFSDLQTKQLEEVSADRAEKLRRAEESILDLSEKLGFSSASTERLRLLAEERAEQLRSAEDRIDDLSGRLESSDERARGFESQTEERSDQLRAAEDKIVDLSDQLESSDAQAKQLEGMAESRAELLQAAEDMIKHMNKKVEFSEGQMKKMEKTVEERATLLKAATARLNGVRSSMGAAAEAFGEKLSRKKKKKKTEGGPAASGETKRAPGPAP